MAKVILPLGSELARGHVGKSIIFQGTTAKAFRKPRNPKSAAQTARRSTFRDFTRTLRVFNNWSRGALRAALGVYWWANVLPLVTSRWATSSADFDAWSAPNRATWLANAPKDDTTEDAGKIFYSVVKAIYEQLLFLNKGLYLLPAPIETNSVDIRAWVDKDLTDVFMPGAYDDDHAGFVYSGPDHWHYEPPPEVVATVFFGMAQHWTISTATPNVEFWFFGRQIQIYYFRAMGYGTMKIEIDNLAVVNVSQSAQPYGMLVYWDSAVLDEGLHFARVSQVGATHPVYFDGLIVSG